MESLALIDPMMTDMGVINSYCKKRHPSSQCGCPLSIQLQVTRFSKTAGSLRSSEPSRTIVAHFSTAQI